MIFPAGRVKLPAVLLAALMSPLFISPWPRQLRDKRWIDLQFQQMLLATFWATRGDPATYLPIPVCAGERDAAPQVEPGQQNGGLPAGALPLIDRWTRWITYRLRAGVAHFRGSHSENKERTLVLFLVECRRDRAGSQFSLRHRPAPHRRWSELIAGFPTG